jgi:hypothetical protein
MTLVGWDIDAINTALRLGDLAIPPAGTVVKLMDGTFLSKTQFARQARHLKGVSGLVQWGTTVIPKGVAVDPSLVVDGDRQVVASIEFADCRVWLLLDGRRTTVGYDVLAPPILGRKSFVDWWRPLL